MNPGETLQGAAHRYELRSLIGSGTFGEVWEAVQVAGAAGVRKRVVVKILAGQGLAWSEGAMRMRDEARMLALVHDPAVVQVYDVFELDGTWGLAMELVEGEDLRASVERGPVPAPLLLSILADVASGLAAVHEVRGLDGTPAKLVHRDIKPENIRVDIRGRGRLIDFGIAKGSFTDREAHTREGQQSPGSLRYMAPERFHGFDVQAGDVYSLGVVLIEALLPDGLGAVRMMTRERLEAHLPRIPAEVRELAAAMTAEAPEARPTAREAAGRMRALAETLQRPVTREVAPPEPIPPTPLPTEPSRPPMEAPTARRRSGLGVGAAVLLALSLVGGAAALATIGYYVSQPAGSDSAASGSAAPHRDVTTEAVVVPVSPGTTPEITVAGASTQSPPANPEDGGAAAPGSTATGAAPTGPEGTSGAAGVVVGAAATVGATAGSSAASTPGGAPSTREAGAGRVTAPSGSPEGSAPGATTAPGNGKDPSGAAPNAPVSGTGCVKVLAPVGATASLRASRSGATATPSGQGPWFFAVSAERWSLTVESTGVTVGTLPVDVRAGQVLTVSCYPPGGCSNKSPLGGPATTTEPRCAG